MISSVRITASADTPADVVSYIEKAISRLQLGNGMGEQMFGASEFVIEGQGGGFAGRVKLNYGPMGAAAEDMWVEGKDPYGADRDECERRRAELNAAHEASIGLFDAPPPGGDFFPPEAVVLGVKVSFPISVQGTAYTLDGYGLEPEALSVMVDAWQRHFTGQEADERELETGWELRDSSGNLLSPNRHIAMTAVHFPLHLNPKAGIGG